MTLRGAIYTFFRESLYSSNRPSRNKTTAITTLKRGMGAFMRTAVLATAFASVMVGLALADPAAAAIKSPTNIAPQELRSALRVLAADRHLQILYPTETVAGRHTEGAVGEFTADEALERLLGGTDLVFRYIDDNTITIMSRGDDTPASVGGTPATGGMPEATADKNKEGKKSSSGGFRVAQVDQGAPGQFPSVGSPPSPDNVQKVEIEEIVVTAQRREESLSKVPISISAFSDSDLKKAGITDMEDLSRATPGFNVQPGATIGGGNNVSIRGVSTVQGAATIGIYIDDVPVSVRANTWTQPVNPSTFDLQRVEVLRGPQGTLYGSGSEGGTLRYITAQPSLTTWSGQAEGEINGNVNGGIGNETGAAVGGPIVQDVLGFRLSVDNRHDGGFIDQVSRTPPSTVLQSNINSTDNTSVRAALTWAPVDGLGITPSFNYQRLHGNDDGLIWSGLWPTNDRYESFEITPTPYTDQVKIGSLRASYDFGKATLTSITSGLWRNLNRADDYSGFTIYQIFGAAKARAFLAANPDYQSPQNTETQQNQYTQEVRLTTNDQHAPVYFTIGGFFSYAKQSLSQDQWADANAGYPSTLYLLHAGQVNPNIAFGPIVPNGPFPNGGIFADKYQEEVDRQIAGFADATWNITSNLRFNGGVRVASLDYSFQYVANGFGQGGPQNLPKTSTNTTQVNPKANISWQATPDVLLYATAAKGERAGGINRPISATRCALDISLTGNIPTSYSDDSVWSYEGGTKARLLDGLFSISGSAFYLKWDKVQQTLILSNCGTSYVGNFGNATSRGGDLSVAARATRWLTLTANAGYTKSTLDQSVTGTVNSVTGIAPVLALKGSPLSYVPNWTADFAAEINYPLEWKNLNGFFRADYQYNGTYYRTPSLGSSLYNPLTYQGEAYDTFNLRSGVSTEAWTFTVFAKNLGNAYPILYKQSLSGVNPFFQLTSTLAPRTFGANINYRF
jgi:iron complex outermembrane recepter protein